MSKQDRPTNLTDAADKLAKNIKSYTDDVGNTVKKVLKDNKQVTEQSLKKANDKLLELAKETDKQTKVLADELNKVSIDYIQLYIRYRYSRKERPGNLYIRWFSMSVEGWEENR